MPNKMFAELQSTSIRGANRLSAHYLTGELTKDEAREIIPELLSNVRGNNDVVNMYLSFDSNDKKFNNTYCRVQWSAEGALHVPPIKEDEIIDGDIYVKWIKEHATLREILEKEEE
ncbi:hypothetical protein MHB73_21155 [Bacillus sp. FSL K6-6483]|uniref:Uncharacterized protein n=1 Tax=Shouchella clausii TaxID=79880 RepID=A0A268P5A8_SHOCL|nr:hypothetical protein [Shouchella clausii]PAE90926.1 hypothetical protein CHH72_00465 [Shouchella clausii]